MIFTTDDLAGDLETLFSGKTYYEGEYLLSEEPEITGELAHVFPAEKDEDGNVTLWQVKIEDGRIEEVNNTLLNKREIEFNHAE